MYPRLGAPDLSMRGSLKVTHFTDYNKELQDV